MGKRFWAMAGCFAMAALTGHSAAPTFAGGKSAKTTAKEAPGKDVFGLTKVWQFHLEITAKDWDKMQPVGGMRGFGGPGPGFGGPDFSKKSETPPVEKST